MLWIGATNAGSDEKFMWVTGEDFNFTDWVPLAELNQKDTAIGFARNMLNGKMTAAKIPMSSGWSLWRANDAPAECSIP